MQTVSYQNLQLIVLYYGKKKCNKSTFNLMVHDIKLGGMTFGINEVHEYYKKLYK
jgi:hypothetical protein